MVKMKTIAFIGIDGSGKTTVIREVCKGLKKRGKTCEVRYMGLGRDYAFPLMRTFSSWYSSFKHRPKKSKDKEVKEFDRNNYRTRKLPWLLIQYLEFWTRFIKNKFIRADYLLYDRYFYDGLILSNDTNFKLLKLITPKPQKCFLIHASSKVILKRKQEANADNINNFYKQAKKLGHYVDLEFVDNEKSLKTVVNEILGKV